MTSDATETGGDGPTTTGKRAGVGDVPEALTKGGSRDVSKSASRDASKTASFKRSTGENSRPNSRGASFRPEFTYDHAGHHVPRDDAHFATELIGNMPAQQLDRTTSRKLGLSSNKGKSFRKNLADYIVESRAETERIDRKSKALAQQVVFKSEVDKHGARTEVGDMKGSLREIALETAAEAVVRGGWDNEVAAFIKKRMDRRQESITGGKWHCIVGPDFGSYVTHERGHFCYFYLPRKLSPIERLEKARVERAERLMAANRLQSQGQTTEDAMEEKLADEIKTRASQAGFSEESAAPHDSHPMFDTQRSGGAFIKGEEDQRMIGILLWRT